MAEPGRPEYTDDQYRAWLDEMRSHLVKGSSLNYAMEMAGIVEHKNAIYRKYGQNDWFREKVDEYRAIFGDKINNFHATEALRIIDKQKQQVALTPEEFKEMQYLGSTHRTAQPFFAQRTETAKAKDEDFGKVVEPAKITYVSPEQPKPTDPAQPAVEQPATDSVPANPQAGPGVQSPSTT